MVEPLGDAKYVSFETLLDPKLMPGQRIDVLKWPYVEGLRMDEAMHPLTLLASGLYGRGLPPQDGAPLRLVIPWKYGFKGIKSTRGRKGLLFSFGATNQLSHSGAKGLHAGISQCPKGASLEVIGSRRSNTEIGPSGCAVCSALSSSTLKGCLDSAELHF
jgi:hypothetical protein